MQQIDKIFVYSTCQQKFVMERWGPGTNRVIWIPFMVDYKFFDPAQATGRLPSGIPEDNRPMICAVGLEYRDYPSLLAAVKGLDVRVVIAAASPWSKRPDTTAGQEIPPNVIVRRFSQYELRDIYARSIFTVMPLYQVDFQAGVTAILEAMALGKAVICTRTTGQTDVVVEGETGIYVSPGDVPAMRRAIQLLLTNPDITKEMGKCGRERIIEEMSLEKYVQRLAPYTT